MKVKIIKCSGKDYWYKNCLELHFNVHNKNDDQLELDNDGEYGRRIEKEDCEIIQEEVMKFLFTEEQFSEVNTFCITEPDYAIKLKKAKEKGWIKKSALEEAREFFVKECGQPNITNYLKMEQIKILYKTAIEEERNKKR